MSLAGDNPEIALWVDVVHEPIDLVDPAAPARAIFERFGLANACGQAIALDVLDKFIDPFERLLVQLLPDKIVFPRPV